MSEIDQQPPPEPDQDVPGTLWPGDTGTLPMGARRALVELVRGPYLSAQRKRELWKALLSYEQELRSRLADMFLELVVDRELEVAFVRNARSAAGDLPVVVRTSPLTLLDSAMVLHLRGELLRNGVSNRCIIGQDEVFDHMQLYRRSQSTDDAGFRRRINSSWEKLVKFGILQLSTTPGRFEVSPVLRLVFGADEIASLRHQYQALIDSGAPATQDSEPAASADATDSVEAAGEEDDTDEIPADPIQETDQW